MDKVVNILLVEDNPGDVRLTVEAFKEGDVRSSITVAKDGFEALSHLRPSGQQSDAPPPDVILLDLNLPRMDGREVLAEIKQDPALRQIPVVVLTTSTDNRDVQQAYDAHANCYIAKPVDLESFVRVVKLIQQFWLGTAVLPNHWCH